MVMTTVQGSVLPFQKPYGLGEKAVCESGSPCSDAPVTSTRRQQFEYSIAWVYHTICK